MYYKDNPKHIRTRTVGSRKPAPASTHLLKGDPDSATSPSKYLCMSVLWSHTRQSVARLVLVRTPDTFKEEFRTQQQQLQGGVSARPRPIRPSPATGTLV